MKMNLVCIQFLLMFLSVCKKYKLLAPSYIYILMYNSHLQLILYSGLDHVHNVPHSAMSRLLWKICQLIDCFSDELITMSTIEKRLAAQQRYKYAISEELSKATLIGDCTPLEVTKKRETGQMAHKAC